LAELAFDLDEERNHARLRTAMSGAGNPAKSRHIDKAAVLARPCHVRTGPIDSAGNLNGVSGEALPG
jgi:hypothetical protein